MHRFFGYPCDLNGVAGSAVARELGVLKHRELRLIELGVLDRPAHRVVRSTTFPETWKQRCRLTTMGPCNGVICHRSARSGAEGGLRLRPLPEQASRQQLTTDQVVVW